MGYVWSTPAKTYSQLVLNPIIEPPKPPPKPVEYTYELVNAERIREGIRALIKGNYKPQAIVIKEDRAYIEYLYIDGTKNSWSLPTRLKKIPVMQESNK